MYDRIEKKLPLVIIIVCVVLGVYGYFQQSSGNPIRVVFQTKGGAVIFDHRAHLDDYTLECSSCHHELDTAKKIYNCRQCHSRIVEEYQGICDDSPIHKQCIGQNCINCHKENGLDTDDCKACHQ